MRDRPIIWVLSIDGGGIRGLIPAIILQFIESVTGKPIYESFDLIAGTSTGGLIATYLTAPHSDPLVENTPAHSTKQLVNLYKESGRQIFDKGIASPITSLFRPKHSRRGLTHVVDRAFGEKQLAESLTNVLVPAYDQANGGQSHFFKSWGDRAWLTRDVALATSAAPTYFAAHKAQSLDRSYAGEFVDGGVFANNPSMCALAETIRLFPGHPIKLLSLGTGTTLVDKGPARGGLLPWASKMADMFLDSGADTVDYQVSKILLDNYLRVNVGLQAGSKMNRVDNDYLDYLSWAGEETYNHYCFQIEEFLELT